MNRCLNMFSHNLCIFLKISFLLLLKWAWKKNTVYINFLIKFSWFKSKVFLIYFENRQPRYNKILPNSSQSINFNSQKRTTHSPTVTGWSAASAAWWSDQCRTPASALKCFKFYCSLWCNKHFLNVLFISVWYFFEMLAWENRQLASFS